MEVFCRNVPPDLTDRAFEGELKPILTVLGIVDWSLEKPRRKPHAWIVFLKVGDASRFLEKHGAVILKKFGNYSKVTQTSRLTIAKTAILVQQSRRSVRAITLKHLDFQREEREQKLREDARHGGLKDEKVKFSDYINGIHCGNIIFAGSLQDLTFIQQTSISLRGLVTFNRRFLLVTFESWSSKVRILISYEIIQDLVADVDSSRVTLVLTEPPRFFKLDKTNGGPSSNSPSWKRDTSCPLWPSHERYVARCLVYQLEVSKSGYLVQQLKKHDTMSVTRYDIVSRRAEDPNLEEDPKAMKNFWSKLVSMDTQAGLLRFTTLFLVQALVFNNYLSPASGTQMLQEIERIVEECRSKKTPFPFSDRAMKTLFKEIPYPCPGTDPSELDVLELLQKVRVAEDKLRLDDPRRFGEFGEELPDSQVWVMKALVTPTRVVLTGPEAENKNRILRKYPNHTDYFLRIQFCDEDGQDLAYNPKISNDGIYQRFRLILQKGITIANRRFSFLGFSHSSLRSHSTWFVASFINNGTLQDYESIVGSLGTFTNIRIPAKCAARIGQAFSETPYSVHLNEKQITVRFVSDFKNEDSSRVFSDGVGSISYEAMREFWTRLPQSAKAPTCFQIRWGGAKGMLTLDMNLKGKQMCVRRESMVKFASLDTAEVGVCDFASRPFRLVLNRQLIKIMEDMRVNEQWFMDLQNKELRYLRAVTATAQSAGTFLRQQLLGVKIGLPAFVKYLDQIGLDYRNERFLRSVVEHAVIEQLRLLKYKARVPVDQGVTLFGVVDETGYLQEGEIYVTFDKCNEYIATVPSTAYVLITRSPALHPGDVRLARMVQPPIGSPLYHLRNCVVFNRSGKRDLPSMLSGGDLDGDLYSIIWDPAALPKVQFEPADYPRIDPKPLDRDVTKDDIADFFINFMKTDVLGVIATRHIMLADLHDEGTIHLDCVALAGLHSTAVDSSKTGIPVNVKDMPSPPRIRPDFMSPAPPLELYARGEIAEIGPRRADENEDDDGEDGFAMSALRYYKSDKILGKLYRNVDENLIWEKDIKYPGQNEQSKSTWTLLFNHFVDQIKNKGLFWGSDDHTGWVHEAIKIRNWYETAMEDYMWQFSDNPRRPLTEVEVFCGSVLNKRGSQTRRQRDSSMKMKEEVDRLMTWITKLIRHQETLNPKVAGEDGDGGLKPNQALALSMACFVVSLRKSKEAEHLESFKVVAACCVMQEIHLAQKRADTDGASAYSGDLGGSFEALSV